MKEIDINIEGYNVNGICVGCLNYNRKMFYDNDVKECFQLLGDIDVPDGLVIQVCWECLAAVRTVKHFQQQILNSYDILISYSKKHTFLNSPKDLSKFATTKLTLIECEVDTVPTFKYEENDDLNVVVKEEDEKYLQFDGERQENVGEFEGESHPLLKEEYPETDPFSASGSGSDEYQPSLEEDEVKKSYFDVSVCDNSADITLSATKDDTNETQPSYILPNITQCEPRQLEPGYVTSTITHGPCQPEGVFTLSTFIEDESQRLTTLMPQTNTEHESHQPQIDMSQNTTEEEQTYLPQNTIKLESCQLQDVMPPTTEGQSETTDCNDSVGKGRRRDFCFYCENHVLSFYRHIVRHHSLEVDVKKILAFPTKSRTRRNLITDLKKKGNYILNVVKCERPMRIVKGTRKSDYLPCPNCLGLYARTQLWNHKKTCDPELSSKHSQAKAQNLMCNSSHTPSKSLEKVISRMRADEISFVAKQDPIICEFGENYLRINKTKQFVHVTSRKMRELAKLLIEMGNRKSEITTIFDALNLQNYDILVAATKTVANYDENTDSNCSPRYVRNISTSLKQCCNIAIKRILKTEPSIKSAEMQTDLRTLVRLIKSRWKFDVSSNAANNLSLKIL